SLVSYFMTLPTTAFYPLSLHDALPICSRPPPTNSRVPPRPATRSPAAAMTQPPEYISAIRMKIISPAYMFPNSRRPSEIGLASRSEEHTSELQSRENLVCRLLLEKKKT